MKLLFAAGLYLAESWSPSPVLHNYGNALYWGVAAFSTAGIADTPTSGLVQFIGGLWIVVGSTLFFGTIVATVTTYFMRPLQRPAKRIIDTIEYNLEQLDDLILGTGFIENHRRYAHNPCRAIKRSVKLLRALKIRLIIRWFAASIQILLLP